MKRRDWKIKELKKNTSDKFLKKWGKYRKKNSFFLRKLNIRRNRKLKKKNYIMNFAIYQRLRNIYFSKLNNYTNIFLFKSLKNYLEVLPIYSFSKNIFLNYNSFLSFLETNNLNYLFLKNYNYNLKNNNFKIVIFSNNKNKEVNLNEINNLLLNNKDNLMAIPKKEIVKINKLSNILNINYFFNYNLFLLNSIEMYKILIILYINNLLK